MNDRTKESEGFKKDEEREERKEREEWEEEREAHNCQKDCEEYGEYW